MPFNSNNYKPLVSIILLNWNGDKYIHACARSIAAQVYKNIQVIVVDNGSVDKSLLLLKTSYPKWTYIQHKENIGFAAGMNSGLEIAIGDYIIPLNQDVYLDKNFIAKSVNIMESLRGAGALGSEEYLWVNGILSDQHRLIGPALFLKLRIKGAWCKIDVPTARSFGINGSFPFLRRKALVEMVKLDGHVYDPAFFSGWEDVDLWWRMQMRGWECFATKETKAWHVGSSFDDEKQTFLEKSTFYQGWIMRNRWLVILKNIPISLLLMLSPLLFTLELVLPFYLLYNSPRSLKAWFHGWRDICASLPSIYAKRRIIQQSRNVNLRLVMSWFTVFRSFNFNFKKVRKILGFS